MLRVLIADDEQFVRVSLRALYDWEANGFEIVGTADNGLEALEKLESLKPDILITDIVMPAMDGLQLLETIRERALPVTVLVISNLGDVDDVNAALSLGAEDYYLKVHFDRDAFNRVMQRIRDAAIKRAGVSGAQTDRAAHENAAQVLANAMAGGPAPAQAAELARHVFLIRVQRYGSEHLNAFSRVYQPLSNLVLETFKGYPETSFAPAPLPDALLVAVRNPIPPNAANQLLKKLDAQLTIYLSASADILHLSAPDGHPSPEGLRRLMAALPERGQTVLLNLGELDAASGTMERVLRYIDDHIDQRLSLPQIARHAGLNPSYLSRAFAQKTGKPLIGYINERKMQKAALLLQSGKHKVKDVALLLGYDDQYYFTRLFTKAHGISPTEYMDSKE